MSTADPGAPPTEGHPPSGRETASRPAACGVYRPPAVVAMMGAQNEEGDRGEAFQRASWDALKKSIHGLINKANVSNIKNIVVELFGENLVRGRGHFARVLIKAQAASPALTPVYAALVSVINSKLPVVGELVLKRLIVQFRRCFKRNDKSRCIAATIFLAHLVNVGVAHEIVALQLLTLLLENSTNDSIEIAIGFAKECGQFIAAACPKPSNLIFGQFRAILLEGRVEKRVQFMIEALFQTRKERFKEYPAIKPELDLVEDDDRVTHYVSLDDEVDPEEALDLFRPSSTFDHDEQQYEEIKTEILGEDDEGAAAGGEAEAEAEAEETGEAGKAAEEGPPEHTVQIQDQTGADIVNLRKTIYLTIMSSVGFEETVHRILKLKIPAGSEIEVCNMIAECCSQERTYLKHYGLIAERLCKLNQLWAANFEQSFVEVYEGIHRYETNRIRNVAKLFAHLLETEAVVWSLFDRVRLSEDDTTASSRIFLKVLFQDLDEHFGKKTLAERFREPRLQEFFTGLFPYGDPVNLRFSINFFTAIGLGHLTDGMRARLQPAPSSERPPPDDGRSPGR